MPRYVAFLRGMNLGGRRITNKDLQACFADLGFDGLATFRASGNVIFEADGGGIAKLSTRIEDGLADALGYDVPVFLRTAAQVVAIAEHQPFTTKVVEASKGKLQVGMLPKKPSKSAQDKVLAMATTEDKLAIRESELYWLPSAGLLDSPLDLKLIAKLLGDMTVRTKGTVDLIAAKHCV